MRKNSRSNKGQFFVIAALLVSVVLVSGVISTYSLVRNSTVTTSPDVLGAIGEMNTGIKSILDFTVGYYGSILQVTGNSSYAQGLTSSYLSSGLVNIARSHPEWNPSFNVSSEAQISTSWFMPESSSTGEISVTYSLGALGLEGITYETSSALTVNTLTSASGQAKISVMRDGSEPELGLTVDNFLFYNYSYADSTWELVNPTNIVISANGVYTMNLPNGVGPNSYSVQIEDNRGIVVSAFYSPSSVESESGIPHYTYTFDWESTGVSDIYDSLSSDNFVIEIFQNGTLNWLGQPFEMDSTEPIPPISVKAFRINATINDVNQQIPFQVEDWASDYMVPLGLSSNDTLFSDTNMLVFMVDNEVSEVTLWWNGNDTATPSSFAWQNNFSGDVSDTYDITLSNGNIDLNVQISGGALTVGSTSGFTSSDAEFLRINGEHPTFGAGTSVVIADGSVRTILQQEPEYSGGATNCPNFYAQLYFTLPLNTNYYTYTSRLLFVESSPSLGRILTNLNVVEVDASTGNALTENGTSSGYPVPDGSTGSYYDQSPSTRDHHWSEFISGSSGTGVMFRDVDSNLYNFDNIIGSDTGAIVVEQTGYPSFNRIIEVNPVDLDSVDFDNSLDTVWTGAVVTFSGEPIHPTSGNMGLWVMVENPPTVSMEEEEVTSPPEPTLEFYVDQLSDEDSSPDKGSHSDFSAQQAGPDSSVDVLTEATENDGGVEDLVDNNTSDVDSSGDVGSHSDFSALQSGPDSVFDTLSESNAGANPVIKVEHIQFDFGDGGSTTSVTDVGDLDNAFFRNNVARRTSAGPTGSSANINWNVFSAGAQLTNTDELTGYRATGQTATVRIMGEVWRYTGPVGGPNEFIVRWRGVVTIDSGSKTSSQSISGISDTDKCVPFVQGVIADLNSRSDGNRVISHAHVDSSNNLVVERGETGTEIQVYVVVVEFTGSNWNVGHALGSSFSTGANNVALFDGSDGTGNSFDVEDWHTAFIEASMSGDVSGDHALEDTGFVIEPRSGSTTGVTITFDSTAGLGGAEVFVHVIQNDNIYVTRYTDSQSIPSSDNHAVSGLTSLDESALEWYVFTDGTGTAYARGATGAYLTSTTNVAEWTHRTGNSGTYRFGVIDLSGLVDTNYEMDLEIQWTDVPYTLPNGALAIFGGAMADENLAVDVWTGSDWETVFSDLSSGWNNASISEWLTGSTFTIRFRDRAITSDSILDEWEIDVALLHVWAEGGNNYQIDLEEQWTNVDYDETNEQLCIYASQVGSENLRVQVWTGSTWETVISSLHTGWNNETVSSYLTSSTFTIRFVGTTETGDTSQDYWTIDVTLLRTWS